MCRRACSWLTSVLPFTDGSISAATRPSSSATSSKPSSSVSLTESDFRTCSTSLDALRGVMVSSGLLGAVLKGFRDTKRSKAKEILC
uniref:Putative secreted protein n=1 Tax=Anopheles darlingi TaxID=43151 RepID=A0A2M4DAS3_ANODA